MGRSKIVNLVSAISRKSSVEWNFNFTPLYKSLIVSATLQNTLIIGQHTCYLSCQRAKEVNSIGSYYYFTLNLPFDITS